MGYVSCDMKYIIDIGNCYFSPLVIITTLVIVTTINIFFFFFNLSLFFIYPFIDG